MAKRILIIDDERDMQVYLGALFRKAGYEVEVAQNGEEGLKKVGEFRPDLVTMDLVMPRRSGVIAFEALRSSPETQEIPVIVVTGLAQHDELFRSDAPDVRPPEAVVEKPIDRERLLETVAGLIGGP